MNVCMTCLGKGHRWQKPDGKFTTVFKKNKDYTQVDCDACKGAGLMPEKPKTELPKNEKSLTVLIDRIYEDKEAQTQHIREHLGASEIGKDCERALWYSFRWFGKPKFDGRMLRLFETGKREEERMANDLRASGLQVSYASPEPQHREYLLGGHFSCEIDGALLGVPESPDVWHVWEAKTHNLSSFLKLTGFGDTKNGEAEYKRFVKTGHHLLADTKTHKPQHWYQMQAGMGFTGMTRALYMAKNKNDDKYAFERVRFEQRVFDGLVSKAERVIFSKSPLARISDMPTGQDCRFCDFKGACHYGDKADVNCRTCKHSVPERAGGWTCQLKGVSLDVNMQLKGCGDYAAI
jgi:hypothetical protein